MENIFSIKFLNAKFHFNPKETQVKNQITLNTQKYNGRRKPHAKFKTGHLRPRALSLPEQSL